MANTTNTNSTNTRIAGIDQDALETAARLLARTQRRATLIRRTSAIAPDPADTFGLSFTRVVGEEHIQAISYGLLGGQPSICTDWDGTRRDGSHLEPVAEALGDYLQKTVRAGQLPRVWVNGDADLFCLELAAQRYHRNPSVSDEVRRLGWYCDALVREATFVGQQLVVNAVDLFRRHISTGQSAIDDLHLDALLAWVSPRPGVEPAAEAARRMLTPLAAMLSRGDDNRVDRLRAQARKNDRVGGVTATRAEIKQLLANAVMREWDLLVAAREAFWRLGLQPDWRVQSLVDASKRRLAYSLSKPTSRPTKPDSLARLLAEQELSLEMAEAIDICGDPVIRERARLAGRVIAAQVLSVSKPKRSQGDCTITLLTSQEVLRVRAGTRLQTLDGRVRGQVTSIREAGQTDDGYPITLITLTVSYGKSRIPQPGQILDWSDTVVVDLHVLKNQAYVTMKEAQSPLVYRRSAAFARSADVPKDPLAGAISMNKARGTKDLNSLVETLQLRNRRSETEADRETSPASALSANENAYAEAEAKANAAVADVLEMVLAQASPLTVLVAPPGSGKTAVILSIIATAVQVYGLRVGVAAGTWEQLYSITRRLAADYQPTRSQILSPSSRAMAEDVLVLPGVLQPTSQISGLAQGPCAIISTAAKWLMSVPVLRKDEIDLLVVDEAYQLAARDVDPLLHLARSVLLVGDPGQLDPLVPVDTSLYETAPSRVHWAAPRELVRRLTDAPVIRLPATRRLAADTVEIVQPAFYKDLPFVSLARPEERRLRFRQQPQTSNAVDRALSMLANREGVSMVGLLLPGNAPTAGIDAEMADLAAAIAARVLELEATWVGKRRLRAEDICCIDAHVASGAAIRRGLRQRGISPERLIADTPEVLQGSERPIVIATHPVGAGEAGLSSGPGRLSEFTLEAGRWCVMLIRHQLACVVIARQGTRTSLRSYRPRGVRPLGAADGEWAGLQAHLRVWQALESMGRLITLQ